MGIRLIIYTRNLKGTPGIGRQSERPTRNEQAASQDVVNNP
jgi:hypothetical protein